MIRRVGDRLDVDLFVMLLTASRLIVRPVARMSLSVCVGTRHYTVSGLDIVA